MLKINGYVLECHDENVFNEMFIDFVEGHGWGFTGMIIEEGTKCYGSFESCTNCECSLRHKCMEATSELLYAEQEEYRQMLEDNNDIL